MHFKISENLYKAITEYLATRPWREVVNIMHVITADLNQCSPIQEELESKKPEHKKSKE